MKLFVRYVIFLPLLWGCLEWLLLTIPGWLISQEDLENGYLAILGFGLIGIVCGTVITLIAAVHNYRCLRSPYPWDKIWDGRLEYTEAFIGYGAI